MSLLMASDSGDVAGIWLRVLKLFDNQAAVSGKNDNDILVETAKLFLNIHK